MKHLPVEQVEICRACAHPLDTEQFDTPLVRGVKVCSRCGKADHGIRMDRGRACEMGVWFAAQAAANAPVLPRH